MNIIKEILKKSWQKYWGFMKKYGFVIIISMILSMIGANIIYKQTADYRLYKFKMATIDWIKHDIEGKDLKIIADEMVNNSPNPSKCGLDVYVMTKLIAENPDKNPYRYLEIANIDGFEKDCK